jgi:hypothetical protein
MRRRPNPLPDLKSKPARRAQSLPLTCRPAAMGIPWLVLKLCQRRVLATN